jgi:maltose/maltodextrin transport system substrate-binding protein
MKSIKQVLTAFAVIASLTFGGPSFAAQEGKLLVWINGDKGYNGLQKVGDRFTKATGIQVVVEHPEDATGKFQQAAAAGKGPDIWIWPHDRLGEWVDGGLLSPVHPSDAYKAEFEKTGWDAFSYKGQIWGYPISFEAVGLIYNKAILPKPPKTFEEIFALDKKLSKKGIKAILWDYNNTYFTWPLLAAGGAYPFAKTATGYNAKDTGVNTEGAYKGVEMLARLIKEGVMPRGASYSDMENGVNKGKIAMMLNGPWSWANLKKNKIDFGVAPIPSIDGKVGRPFVGVLGAMINHASTNKDLAVEFIEHYMTTPAGLKTINDDVPLGAVANKEFFKTLASDPHIKATMENVKLGEPMPSNPEMGRFWSAMGSALENISTGRQEPREALDAAAKRIVR